MEKKVFKRKIYTEIRDWKEHRSDEYALLIQGARRVGKSTIAVEFARQNFKSYILIDIIDSFVDALYWATVSLTTMGYGDIYPVSTVGRIVTMLSSFIGIAIVTLPAGIITAGYMTEIQKDDE